jgi:hypothetical protein
MLARNPQARVVSYKCEYCDLYEGSYEDVANHEKVCAQTTQLAAVYCLADRDPDAELVLEFATAPACEASEASKSDTKTSETKYEALNTESTQTSDSTTTASKVQGLQEPFFASALHSFNVTVFPEVADRQILYFEPGTQMEVIEANGGWWFGRSGDKQGWFPANYVKKL